MIFDRETSEEWLSILYEQLQVGKVTYLSFCTSCYQGGTWRAPVGQALASFLGR